MGSTPKSGRNEPAGEPIDRRRAPRYLACFPVKIEPSVGVERLCVCRDMSSTGGMMMTQSRLPVGESIKLALYLSNDVSDARHAKARVVRLKRRSVRNSFWLYDAAMSFEEPMVEAEPVVKALSEKQHRLGLYRRKEG
jgi:PilZ domain